MTLIGLKHYAYFLLQFELGMIYRLIFLGDNVSVVLFIAMLQSGRRLGRGRHETHLGL